MKTRANQISNERGRTATLGARRGARPAAKSPATSSSRRGAAKTGAGHASAETTTDHEQIRKWVEERGGQPAMVKRGAQGNRPEGILRIDFPGGRGAQSLKRVDWDDWFQIFDERHLAFLQQDRTATHKLSRFNKIICR